MNSKTKGDTSEAQVLAALVRQGFPVLIPFGDNQRYDLVAEIKGLFKRIQCKTGRYREGSVSFNTSSNGAKVTDRRTYEGEIDYFGIYCEELNQVYLVPFEDVADVKKEAFLRVEASRNNQQKRTRLAKDYQIT